MGNNSREGTFCGKYGRDCSFLLLLTLVCFFTHYFTLDWELPAMYEHAADTAVPYPAYSASEMFYGSAMAYGPFHYVILNLFSPRWQGDMKDCPDPLRLTSARIMAFRTVAAVMDCLMILSLYLICRILLNLPPVWSLYPALAFSLLPVTLYYSHTSNMEVPYNFWLFAAVLTAGLARKRERDHFGQSVLLNLAAGVLIACAFCTKDQVYGVCVLPAFFYVFCRWRSAEFKGLRRLFHALFPLLLWGAAFACTTVLIYGLCVGWNGFSAHWQFISGEGKNDFFSSDGSLLNRLILVWTTIRVLGMNLDYAGLFLLLSAVLLSIPLFRKQTGWVHEKIIFLYSLCAILSQEILYYQVVRRCEFRWNIPLSAIVLVLIFLLLRRCCEEKQKLVQILLIVFFLVQSATAGNFLYNLKNSPLTRFTEDLKQNPDMRITVLSAAEGHMYIVRNGAYTRIEVIKSWQKQMYGLPEAQIVETLPDLFCGYWLDARVILVPYREKLSPEFQSVFSHQQGVDYTVRAWIPTLCPLMPKQISLIPRVLNWNHDPTVFSGFAKMSLNHQLLTITILLQKKQTVKKSTLVLLGKLLQPFTEPETGKYNISPASLMAAHAAYAAAGRTQDQTALAAYLRTQKK